MCVSSHHFPPTGQSAGHSKHEKHPFYRRPPAPPPPGLFLFLQSQWWTPRETVWHWWLLRASFPWVKYQAPVRPVSSSTHRHTKHTHKLKACWEAFATPTSPDMYFVLFSSFPFWVSNGCNGSREERKHLYSHAWQLRGRRDAPLRSVSGGLPFGWPGPEQALRNGST